MLYQIRFAKRSERQGSILTPEYDFRMLSSTKDAKASDPAACQPGLLSAIVQKDTPRSTFLISDEEWDEYIQQLSHLDGAYYVQGDFNGGSDQVAVQVSIVRNNQHHKDAGPISLELSYLRNDKTLGGVTLLWDPIAQGFSITVVAYPSNPTSYNDAFVIYLFHEALAKKAFLPSADDEPLNFTEKEMLGVLKKALNNSRIFQLLSALILNNRLMHVRKMGGHNEIYKHFTTKKPVVIPHSNTQAYLSVIDYSAAEKALVLANLNLFFDDQLTQLEKENRDGYFNIKKTKVVQKARLLLNPKKEEPELPLDATLEKTQAYYRKFEAYRELELNIQLISCRTSTETYLKHLQQDTSPNTLTQQKIILIKKACSVLNERITNEADPCAALEKQLKTFKEIIATKDNQQKFVLAKRKDSHFILFVKGLGTIAAAIFGLGIGGYFVSQRFFKVAGNDFLRPFLPVETEAAASKTPTLTLAY